MQQSHVGAVYGGDQRRAIWLAIALAATLGLGLGGVLLFAQPALSETARTMVEQRLSSTSAQWATGVIMVGLATGIAGAGVFMLAGFVRTARQRPFLMLAPLLCALSAAALGRLPLELSLGPLGSANFALPALLLALGGAAIFQLRGPLAKIGGVLIWLLPAALLLGGATSYQDGWSPRALLSPLDQPLTAILLLSWLALAVIAFIAPDARDSVPSAVMRRRVSALEQQLAEAEDRARVVAQAPAQANHAALMSARKTIAHLQGQLAHTERQTLQNTDLRETLLTTQGKLRRLESAAILGHSRLTSYVWLFGLLIGTVTATTATGYLLYLHPMQERLAHSESDTTAAAGELSSLRAELRKQRRESSDTLAALRGELSLLREKDREATKLAEQRASKVRVPKKLVSPSDPPAKAPSGEPHGAATSPPSTATEAPPSKSPALNSNDAHRPQVTAPDNATATEPRPPAKGAPPQEGKAKDDPLKGFINDDPLGGL